VIESLQNWKFLAKISMHGIIASPVPSPSSCFFFFFLFFFRLSLHSRKKGGLPLGKIDRVKVRFLILSNRHSYEFSILTLVTGQASQATMPRQLPDYILYEYIITTSCIWNKVKSRPKACSRARFSTTQK